MNSKPVPETVIAAAHRHLASVIPPRGLRWKAPEGYKVASGWFFFHRVEWPYPTKKPIPGFGFAPGYLVADDGSVRVIGEIDLRQVFGR